MSRSPFTTDQKNIPDWHKLVVVRLAVAHPLRLGVSVGLALLIIVCSFGSYHLKQAAAKEAERRKREAEEQARLAREEAERLAREQREEAERKAKERLEALAAGEGGELVALVDVYLDKAVSDPGTDITDFISLMVKTLVRHKDAYALLNIGNFVGQFLSGDLRLNSRVAETCFRIASEIYYTEHSFDDWAEAQNNLAVALHARAGLAEGNERAKLLSQAVEAYHAALTVHTKEHAPASWARIQNNLGTTFQDQSFLASSKEQVEILDQAVEVYYAALEIYTLEDFPESWAMVQSNLGPVFPMQANLIEGTAQTLLLERALKASEAALTIYTKEHHPTEWADIRVETTRGARPMEVLIVEAIPRWVLGINFNSLAPEKRPLLIALKAEAFDVFYGYFFGAGGGQATNPALEEPAAPHTARPRREQRQPASPWELIYGGLEMLATGMEGLEQEHQAMSSEIATLKGQFAEMQQWREGQGAAGPAPQRARVLSMDHLIQLTVLAEALRSQTGEPIKAIYADLSRAFGVEEVNDIPDAGWQTVLSWLWQRGQR